MQLLPSSQFSTQTQNGVFKMKISPQHHTTSRLFLASHGSQDKDRHSTWPTELSITSPANLTRFLFHPAPFSPNTSSLYHHYFVSSYVPSSLTQSLCTAVAFHWSSFHLSNSAPKSNKPSLTY